MMLPVFSVQNFSYSYETNTGNYLLYDSEYKTHAYLQGKDARIFREQLEIIDNLKDPENKTGLLTEQTINLFL